MTDGGVTRSKRVAIIQAEAGVKLILTEFEVMDPRLERPEVQLQLTTFGASASSGHGGYARLTQHQAGELETALRNWLHGTVEAP